jgi:hypothetical protein
MSNLIVINNFDDPEVKVKVFEVISGQQDKFLSDVPDEDGKNPVNLDLTLPTNIKFDPQEKSSGSTVDNSSFKLKTQSRDHFDLHKQANNTWLLQIQIKSKTTSNDRNSDDTTTVEIGHPQ